MATVRVDLVPFQPDRYKSPCSRLSKLFRDKLTFYGEGLLASRPTTKLEDHPLSFVSGCSLNTFSGRRSIKRTGAAAVPYYARSLSRHDITRDRCCGSIPRTVAAAGPYNVRWLPQFHITLGRCLRTISRAIAAAIPFHARSLLRFHSTHGHYLSSIPRTVTAAAR
jgi:hypothetical protein